MNVTIKISEELCKAARHRAVDAGCSLSGWISDVVSKELSRSEPKRPKTLLEALGSDELSNIEIDFPKIEITVREVDFS